MRNLLEDGNTKIFPGLDLSKGELLAMLFSLSVRHNLSKACLSDLLTLMTTIVPDCVPKTLYLLMKKLNLLDLENQDYSIYFYCQQCKSFLGAKKAQNKSFLCESCNITYTADECEKINCYFIYTPIEQQLKDMLQTTNLWELIKSVTSMDSNMEEDKSEIWSGNCYKKLKDFLRSGANFTMTYNTDGVRVQKSNNFDIWPLFCSINELGFQCKGKFIVLCGLWFGPHKPLPETFFEPFVNEVQSLFTKGFEWIHKESGMKMNSKVMIGN